MNEDLLPFARAWKKGYTKPVHTTVARRLNQALRVAGEDSVPLKRSTDDGRDSLNDILFREYARAFEGPEWRSTPPETPDSGHIEQQVA